MKQVERADVALELACSRVRGVAGARLIVAADQVGIPSNGVEHLHSRVGCGGWILGKGPGGGLDLHQTWLARGGEDRKSTRLNSSHVRSSYAVFCLKKQKRI